MYMHVCMFYMCVGTHLQVYMSVEAPGVDVIFFDHLYLLSL